jgi:hypothetical protein
MKETEDKYGKVLEILRKSKPELSRTSEIEEKIYSGIFRANKNKKRWHGLTDVLFGWTSVSWMRRSLVGAAGIMVLAFVLQQSIILREIRNLNMRIEVTRGNGAIQTGDDLARKVWFFRSYDRIYRLNTEAISQKKVEELLKSIDKVGREYKDLQYIIENDPELRKLIEKKLSEVNSSKIKL